MKYSKKLPQTNKELSSQLIAEGWIRIKEPRNMALAVLLSFPFTFLLGGITAWFAYLLKPEIFNFYTADSMEITFTINFKIVLFVVAIFTYMFVHEMIHAIFIPKFVKSEKTFWGLNWGFGFVFTTESIKKRRFLLISCMPFVILSIAPIPFLNLFGWINWYTLSLCLINAVGSCVDFLNMALIVFQVKGNYIIISNGFETFYCPAND